MNDEAETGNDATPAPAPARTGPGELSDAALGVAAVAGQAASGVAGVAGGAARLVARSPVGHLMGALARPVVEPLAGAGRELREQVADDAPVQQLAGTVVDLVLDSVDLDALLAQVDVDELLARVDVNAVLARVDVNAVLDRVDPDRLLDRVDPDRLLDRVDPDRLLDRVDPDRLLDRVDPDRLLERVDLDAVMAKVDVNALVQRVDVDDLMTRTELGAVIAKSTTGVATNVLDVVRSQGVGLDQFFGRWVDRVLRRDRAHRTLGPAALVGDGAGAPAEGGKVVDRDRDVGLQGYYAGGVSRLAAYLVDLSVATTLFGLGLSFTASVVELVTSWQVDPSNHPVLVGGAALVWYFLWFFYPWAVSGKTLGMAVLGIRVVRADGADLPPRGAFVRTVTFPFSFLLFGLGFVGIVLGRHHRAWHDHAAGSVVVYAWDARVARLRFLAKHASEVGPPATG